MHVNLNGSIPIQPFILVAQNFKNTFKKNYYKFINGHNMKINPQNLRILVLTKAKKYKI